MSAVRKPIVTVITEVPGLYEPLKTRLAGIVSKISEVDAFKTSGEEPEIKEADIIISDPHLANLWIQGLPNLRAVLGTWAGVDSLIKIKDELNVKPTFQYCRYGGSFGPPIAEYVIAFMVAQERNMRMTFNQQAKSEWSLEVMDHIRYTTRFLNDLTVGILGMGDIGKEVAKVCKAFNMTVWGLVTKVPEVDKRCPHVDEYRSVDELDDLLSNSDYVVNILPSTRNTRGLLDNNKLELCKNRRSVFMNVGRGDICTEESILNALHAGWIRAAILDVFNPEPLDEKSKLWTHPDIIITPHVGAVSLPHLLTDLLIENVKNHMSGNPLKFAIDWEKGY